MPSDKKLKVESLTRLATMTTADAARTLADDYGLSADSVRGRLSRTKGLEVIRELSLQDNPVELSVDTQRAVIEDSTNRWEAFTRPAGIARKAAFISDIHFPFARWDALELTLKILHDFAPDVVSVGNDLMDNDGMSRWDDERSVREKLWSSDIANARQIEQLWYDELSFIPMKVDVPGNHDNWYFNWLRANVVSSAEATIAEYMKWRQAQGILQFSRGKLGQAEPAIHLSDNLVWWHGQYVNKNPVLRGKKTVEQFMTNGVAKTVVVGHTHRPAWVTGAMMGYHGVNFYNAPCNSRIERVPYSKRDPREWGLGMVLHEYRQGTRNERGYLLIYEEVGNKLVAQFAGREYTATLDKRQPNDR